MEQIKIQKGLLTESQITELNRTENKMVESQKKLENVSLKFIDETNRLNQLRFSQIYQICNQFLETTKSQPNSTISDLIWQFQ